MKIFLDLAYGDVDGHSQQVSHHQQLKAWLKKNAQSYGLADQVNDLDEVGRETVSELWAGENPDLPCYIDEPPSLTVGRLIIELSSEPNLAKYVENFRLLVTGAQALGKNKKSLKYKGTPIHRFVKGFVMQGGDVTRFDGSGGESIYGSSMADPKPPHAKHSYGCLSMASSSSKNSATSQFFITLCPAQSAQAAKKLDGKYFPFGQLVGSAGGGRVGKDGEEVLKWLDENVEVDKGENPTTRLWIAECGLADV